MKVLDIYSKKDLDRLTVKGKIVSQVMEDFFKKFPESYRENYDKNLLSVEMYRVDEYYTDDRNGEYSDLDNIIIFKKYSALIHELMHMAACDFETRINSIERGFGGIDFEQPLIEGMTEHLACRALNIPVEIYVFEEFVVSMLAYNSDKIFEPFFIPSHDKFISLFPRKKDIISLMYSLSAYSKRKDELFNAGPDGKDELFTTGLEHSITDTIDSLINIQLSKKLDYSQNKLYGEMFMDLISSDIVKGCLADLNDDYLDYANDEVKKRILRR